MVPVLFWLLSVASDNMTELVMRPAGLTLQMRHIQSASPNVELQRERKPHEQDVERDDRRRCGAGADEWFCRCSRFDETEGRAAARIRESAGRSRCGEDGAGT